MNWLKFAPTPVVGVDEAGRGCLAGPVVAGAVILSRKGRRRFGDSKVLSESRREELFEIIQAEHTWAVGFATVEEIDRLNILWASMLAMRRALEGLKSEVLGGHVLVDGKVRIPNLASIWSQTTLIEGDSRCEPVSAASIVAKVTRDRWMKKLAEGFPEYGFEIHKGYGTSRHRDALARLGPCAEHRRSFRGVFDADPEIARD